MAQGVDPLDHMALHGQNGAGPVRYEARFDEYWIGVGDRWQRIRYCPWCGELLPPSQREQWFTALEARGYDPFFEQVPEEFLTGAWRELDGGNEWRE